MNRQRRDAGSRLSRRPIEPPSRHVASRSRRGCDHPPAWCPASCSCHSPPRVALGTRLPAAREFASVVRDVAPPGMAPGPEFGAQPAECYQAWRMGLHRVRGPLSATRGGVWGSMKPAGCQMPPGVTTTSGTFRATMGAPGNRPMGTSRRLTCSRASAMLRQLWTGSPFGAASEPVAASLTIDTTQGLGR